MVEKSTEHGTWKAASGTQKCFSCLGLWEERAVYSKCCFGGQENREENTDLVTSTNCCCSSASWPRLQEASHPDSELPVLIRRGWWGRPRVRKSWECSLLHPKFRAILSSRSILTEASRSSEAKGPRLLLQGLGGRKHPFSPLGGGGFDDSEWPALAQSPGWTRNPHFFWVTESLCLEIISQIGTLYSLWVCPSPSGMTLWPV